MGRIDAAQFYGVVVPTVTPLNEREEVQLDELKKVNQHMIDGGVHGLFPLGTTGEFARLDDDQKEQVAKITVEQAAGKLPVYIGVGDTGTRKVLRNIKRAESWGADVIVSTLPYYYPVRDVKEQLQFFEAIADSTHLPIMLYNIPSTIGVNISIDVVEQMARKANVIGIKDSSGSFDYIQACLKIKSESDQPFQVFVGEEKLSKDGLWNGADGLVPSLGNVLPKLFAELFDACVDKDEAKANELQKELLQINRFNQLGDSWMGALIFRKKMLGMMGLCSDYVSKPSLAMDDSHVEEIRAIIQKWA